MPALCCFCNNPSLTLLVMAAGAWEFLCGKTGMSSLVTLCIGNTGDTNTLSLKESNMHYLLLIPAAWPPFWFQSISLLWRDGKSFKISKDRISIMSPEHVYDWGLLQNSTHSRASHFPNFLGLLILWGVSLHQQSILTCRYSIHEFSVFSFKFPSDWSLGGLFLTQICAFTKKAFSLSRQSLPWSVSCSLDKLFKTVANQIIY